MPKKKRKTEGADSDYVPSKKTREDKALVTDVSESEILALLESSCLDFIASDLPQLGCARSTWRIFVEKYNPKLYIKLNNFSIENSIKKFLESIKVKYTSEDHDFLIEGDRIFTIFDKLCEMHSAFEQKMKEKFAEVCTELDDELALQVWSYNLTHDFLCSPGSDQAVKKEDSKFGKEPLILEDPSRLYEKRINLLVKFNDRRNMVREGNNIIVMPCIVKDLYNKLKETLQTKFGAPQEIIHEKLISELKHYFSKHPFGSKSHELKFAVDNIIAYYEELRNLLEARTIYEGVECIANPSYDGSGEVILKGTAIDHLGKHFHKALKGLRIPNNFAKFSWGNKQESESDDDIISESDNDLGSHTESDDNEINEINETSSPVNTF